MARRLIAFAAVAALVAGAACDEAPEVAPPEPRAGPRIVVGAFDFTESELLAEIYAQALVAHRYDAVVRRDLDFDASVGAFEEDRVGLLVEYTGHALRSFRTAEEVTARSPERITRALAEELREHRLRLYQAGSAENRDTFVVTERTAKRWKLRDISDLRRIQRVSKRRLRLGAPPGCDTRLSCLRGLREVYGLNPRFIELDAAGPRTLRSLEKGTVDFALMYSSQGALHANDLVQLRDDRRLQLPQHLVPVVHQRIHAAYSPGLRKLIDRITRALKPDVLIALNQRTEVAAQDPAQVARRWLRRSGLLEPERGAGKGKGKGEGRPGKPGGKKQERGEGRAVNSQRQGRSLSERTFARL